MSSIITTLFDQANIQVDYRGQFPDVDITKIICLDTKRDITFLIAVMDMRLELTIWDKFTDECREDARITEGII